MHVVEAVMALQPCDKLTAPLPLNTPHPCSLVRVGLYIWSFFSLYVPGSLWTEPKDTLWGYESMARADVLSRSHVKMAIRRSANVSCRQSYRFLSRMRTLHMVGMVTSAGLNALHV